MVSENDLLHFDEKSGIVIKQVLYNVVFSYDVLPIPGFPDYYVAPSIDQKMLYFMHLDRDSMIMKIMLRLNI